MKALTTSSSVRAARAACWRTGLSADPAIEVLLIEAAAARQVADDPHAGRHSGADRQAQSAQLVLRHGRPAASEQPPSVLAARARLGRIVVDQRHDLHPRPCARLRPLAPDGLRRLVVRRCAALFQARGSQRERRRRFPWRSMGRCMSRTAAPANPLFRAFVQAGAGSGPSGDIAISTAGSRKVSGPTS